MNLLLYVAREIVIQLQINVRKPQCQLLLCTRVLILIFNSTRIKHIKLNYDKLNDDYAREMNLNCT
jgi:hypothetical protein